MGTNTIKAMRAPRTCKRCGGFVPPNAPDNLCPHCLFDTAVELDSDTFGRTQGIAPIETQAPNFGDYELLGELGRGGQAIVYRARHIGLGRVVALKTIPAPHLRDQRAQERFRLEASMAARLDHLNIVPIYEVGERDGFCFYSMKLIEGGTVEQLLAEGLPDAASCRHIASVLGKVAKAVHHAHQRGVLHRDLKPSNVLLDAEHEPHVSDFGLARHLEEESSLTLTQAVIGTPAYVAPEIAKGGARQATIAADIYGLGAILYHLLTGRPPFTRATLAETLRAVQEDEPIWLRRLNPSILPDLETICLKGLDKDPARRYATAKELGEDLERFLRKEPIMARPVVGPERLWRWCKRKPVIASLVAALLLTMGFGMAGVLWEWRLAEHHAASEARERSRAQAGELSARQHQYVADMNLAKQAWEEGNLNKAQELLRSHIPSAGEPELRGFEWRYLWKLCQDESVHTIKFENDDSVFKLATTPAHNFVAAACDRTIRLLDPATGSELARLSYPNPNAENGWSAIALAAGATNLLAAHRAGGVISLWDIAGRRQLMTFQPFTNNVSVLGLSPDGNYLAVADQDRFQYFSTVLSVWDISARPGAARMVWSFPTRNAITALTISPDGQTLVVARDLEDEMVIDSWDLKTGRELERIRNASRGIIRATAFSPNGALLAAGGVGGPIKVWNFADRTFRNYFDGHAGDLESLAFSHDGTQLISAGEDGTIRRWNMASRNAEGLWRLGQNGQISAVFAPDGSSIVSASREEVKIWSAVPREAAAVFNVPQGWSWQVVSPDGKDLVVSGFETATVWEIASGRHKFDLVSKLKHPLSLAFAPKGRLFAMASVEKEGLVGLWDTSAWGNGASRYEPFVYLTNGFESASLSFSPHGEILAAAGLCFPPSTPKEPSFATNRLVFWEVASWKRLNLLSQAGVGATEWAAAASVAFSPNGRLVAIGSRDGWVRLWDFNQQRLLKEWKAHEVVGFGVVVAFSADSRWLSSYSGNAPSLVLFDLADVENVQVVRLHLGGSEGFLSSLFAPDGKTLVTASGDGSIQLWNLQTRSVALTLRHGLGPGGFLAMAPDGNTLISKDGNGVVKVWSATPVAEVPKFAQIEKNGEPQ
jgi:WD40 repeat protein/tRNA A-37 threonylcarbamoyl transferase component Bud32